jgi:rubrerythrin
MEYKGKTCTAETDLEALNIGIDSEKKSIEILSQLVAGEKKMDVRVIFNHLLVEEKKHLIALEELKQTLIQE